MADSLLAAMVQASKAYANPIAADYAAGNRIYVVTLERPGRVGDFNRLTGQWVDTPDATLYTGPARIYPASGGADLEIGDERTPFNAATISINLYEGLPPRVDDVVRVTSTPLSRSTHLADRVFEVTGIDVGGHFSIGWSLQTLGAGPSRHGG